MQAFSIPEISLSDNPPVGYHYAVIFLVGGFIPNPIDMRFKKVSGISSEIETTTLKEGGENQFTHRLPNRVQYGNLKLERGMMMGSPLNLEVDIVMSTLEISPGNVLIALLNEESNPISAWLFWKTYPVKWNISDLDADNNSIVIESIELAYTRFQTMRI